jgi:hypothetical protein
MADCKRPTQNECANLEGECLTMTYVTEKWQIKKSKATKAKAAKRLKQKLLQEAEAKVKVKEEVEQETKVMLALLAIKEVAFIEGETLHQSRERLNRATDNKAYVATLLATIANARKTVQTAIRIAQEKLQEKLVIKFDIVEPVKQVVVEPVKQVIIEPVKRVKQLSFAEEISITARKMIEARQSGKSLKEFNRIYAVKQLSFAEEISITARKMIEARQSGKSLKEFNRRYYAVKQLSFIEEIVITARKMIEARQLGMSLKAFDMRFDLDLICDLI